MSFALLPILILLQTASDLSEAVCVIQEFFLGLRINCDSPPQAGVLCKKLNWLQRAATNISKEEIMKIRPAIVVLQLVAVLGACALLIEYIFFFLVGVAIVAALRGGVTIVRHDSAQVKYHAVQRRRGR